MPFIKDSECIMFKFNSLIVPFLEFDIRISEIQSDLAKMYPE